MITLIITKRNIICEGYPSRVSRDLLTTMNAIPFVAHQLKIERIVVKGSESHVSTRNMALAVFDTRNVRGNVMICVSNSYHGALDSRLRCRGEKVRENGLANNNKICLSLRREAKCVAACTGIYCYCIIFTRDSRNVESFQLTVEALVAERRLFM